MQTPTRKGLAVGDRASHLRLWLTVASGLAVDLGSKALAWRLLGAPTDGEGAERVLLAGWLRLATSKNFGIVFGINFSEDLGLGAVAGGVLTVLLTIATCALILYLFSGTGRSQRWMHVACGLTLAGALGNLYDRLLFGYVRDFIQFALHVGGRALWPYIFNMADVYLVVGVGVLVFAYVFGGRRQAPADEPPSDPRSERGHRGA
jgi:signal peptidase II